MSLDPKLGTTVELRSSGATLFEEARTVLELWACRQSVIQRSVESLQFLPAGGIRRRLTLHLQFPANLSDTGTRFLVPMTLSAQASRLFDVEATDGSGRRLPIASRHEMIMVVAAAAHLSLQDRLDGDQVRATLIRVLAREIDEHDAGARAVLESLPESLASLVEMLLAERLLLVAVSSPLDREVLTVTWEEELARGQQRRSLSRGSSLAATLFMDLSTVPNRHITIEMPDGLVVDHAALVTDAGVQTLAFPGHGHVELPGERTDGLLLHLRPMTRTLWLVLAFLAAAFGLTLALLLATPLASDRNASGALLLLLPSVVSAWFIRPTEVVPLSRMRVLMLTVFGASFVAAAALVVGAEVSVLRSVLSASAAVLLLAMAVVAIAFLPRRLTFAPEDLVMSSTHFYRVEPTQLVLADDDAAVSQAVEDLINSLPPVEPESKLSAQAAGLAEQRSWVPVERPEPPVLAGRVTADVITLTGLSQDELAHSLDVASDALDPRRPDDELEPDLRSRLFGLRVAGMTLYGGLGPRGVAEWLTAGSHPPLEAVAAGKVEQLREQLARYRTSPAE